MYSNKSIYTKADILQKKIVVLMKSFDGHTSYVDCFIDAIAKFTLIIAYNLFGDTKNKVK